MRNLATWIVGMGVILSVACDRSDHEATARTGVSQSAEPQHSSATTSPPSAPRPPPVTSPDVDVPALEKGIPCYGTPGHKDVCRIVAEFGAGGAWQPRIPSGEGRWAGYAYALEGGKEKTDVVLLSAREVPTNTIAPGDLPLRVGTGALPDSLRTAGTKLASALARDDTVSKTNSALTYLNTWTSQREYSAVPTTGKSTRLVAEHETYVRQGKGQKIVVVQVNRGTSNAGAGDGVYMELWPISW